MEVTANMQFFIAGIIQGSIQGTSVFDQNYRQVIKSVLAQTFPECTIVCPVENHPSSVDYPTEKAASVFHEHVRIVTESTALIVYLPEASMGSSIEMWEARRAGVPIVSITPMLTNWVVRILSDRICDSLDDFGGFVGSGGLSALIEDRSG
ncbi:hypothetical protein JXO52_11415 [bacterium]|nr:hypothetical protein [bacterium]